MPAYDEAPRGLDTSVRDGARIYTYILPLYDVIVLWLSNSFIWQCPSHAILDFYNAHISASHLDVGVGSGYFLDRCHFPSANPDIVLADLNPTSLKATARRISRYQPRAVTMNIFEPLPLASTFDSIGINYVLHCLPGAMTDKRVVFTHLRSALNPGGKVFGTTILGQGVERSPAARSLMRLYNARHVFSNHDDSLSALERALAEHFATYTVSTRGCVAFFVGET